MNFLEEMQEEPWRFDFFAAMRRIERDHPDKPRIGDSATLRDDYVRLGQNPYLAFPASNLEKVETLKDGQLRIIVKFLGLMGPQGALPLATTEEALGWLREDDDAFARFLDIFNHRFLQLFFRAWADARPIAQHDQPAHDRFRTYIGASIGIGSPTFFDRDSVPDEAKLRLAGLMGPQTRGASRLRSIIADLFGVTVEIEEFVGSRLTLEPGDCTRLGARNSALGQDVMVGGTCFTIEDKFRIRIFVRDLPQYVRFLPTGDRCEPLADLVLFYMGEQLDWDVELALPSGSVQPSKLGSFGQLGWTTWMSPNWTSSEDYRRDARFHPAERTRRKRQQVKETQKNQ
jgi:type VI secretion system protein ImpH